MIGTIIVYCYLHYSEIKGTIMIKSIKELAKIHKHISDTFTTGLPLYYKDSYLNDIDDLIDKLESLVRNIEYDRQNKIEQEKRERYESNNGL